MARGDSEQQRIAYLAGSTGNCDANGAFIMGFLKCVQVVSLDGLRMLDGPRGPFSVPAQKTQVSSIVVGIVTAVWTQKQALCWSTPLTQVTPHVRAHWGQHGQHG